ncbi:BNR repeat-like domain protein [Candidatus Tiddalikarchaeum anstoanum]|nr:BNR repeat-like domain protein [Candidatus Tiddalikarchaeum anstoanum]
MRKAITPIIATSLLVLMTIIAFAASFLWINNVQTRLQESAGSALTTSSGISACSRLNIISMRGDGIVVQNSGCEAIQKVTLIIDGQLTSYDLTTPLLPGSATTITYTSLAPSESHCVKALLNDGTSSQTCSSALRNTQESGYGATTCTNLMSIEEPGNLVSNPGFEDGFTGWNYNNKTVGDIIMINTTFSKSGSNSVYLAAFNLSENEPVIIGKEGIPDTASYLSFSIFGAKNITASDSAVFVDVFYNMTDGQDQNAMFYVFYTNPSFALCGEHPNGPNSYARCIKANENSWNTYEFNPLQDLFDYTGYDATGMPSTIYIGAMKGGSAYLDDIRLSTQTPQSYCDSNSDSVADGWCVSGSCVNFDSKCSSGYMVDWSGSASFQPTDTYTCGCSEPSQNTVLNPGFENGLTDWGQTGEIPAPATLETVSGGHTGKALHLADSGFSFSGSPPVGAGQNITGDEIKFWIKGALAGPMTAALTIVQYLTSDPGATSLYYAIYQNGLSSMCTPSSNIICIDGLTDNDWNEVTLHPDAEAETRLGINPSLYSKRLYIGVINTDFLIDDVFIGESSNGKYCDSNSNSLADGVCNTGLCRPYVFTGISVPLQSFWNNTATFSANYLSIPPLDSCNLYLNDTSYSMTINPENVTFSGKISSGVYEAKISCTSQGFSYNSSTLAFETSNWDDIKTITSDAYHASNNAFVAANDSNVYLTWADNRDGNTKTYFENSLDSGGTFNQSVTNVSGANYWNPTEMLMSGNRIHLLMASAYMNSSNGINWNPYFNIGGGSDLFADGNNIYIPWGNFYTLFVENSSNNGVTWGTLSNTTNILVNNPNIAAKGDNVYVVFSTDYNTYPKKFYFMKSSDKGLNWTVPVNLFYNNMNQTNPAITVLDNNDVYISWSEQYIIVNQDRDEYRSILFYSKSSDNGATWSANQTFTQSEGYCDTPYMVAAGTDVHVTYRCSRSVYYTKLPEGGMTQVYYGDVSNSNGDVASPAMAVYNDKMYFIWTERATQSSNRVVKYRRYYPQ